MRTSSSSATAGSRTGEIRALTGLRVVAAVVVMLGHFKPLLLPYLDYVPVVRPVLDAGWLGVEIFFVLSGFVIARNYVSELGTKFRLGAAMSFIYARFARIWPVWAVVTTGMAAWIWTVRATGHYADVIAPHPAADLSTLLRQLSMTGMWGTDALIGPNFVLPGWSISAEWAAYLAFPILALILLPLRRLPPVLTLLLATLAMSPLAVTAYRIGPLDPEVDWRLRLACCFIAGVLCAVALIDVEQTASVERLARGTAITATVVFVVMCFWAHWRRAGDQAHDYAGVATIVVPALIVSLALTQRGPASFLARPWMVYGGRISYCLYLIHFVVYDVVMTVWWQNPVERSMTPGLALVSPLLLVVCVLLAAGLHHGIEQPVRKLLLVASPAGSRRRSARSGSDDRMPVVPYPAVDGGAAVPAPFSELPRASRVVSN